MMLFSRRKHRRPRGIGRLPLAIIIVAFAPPPRPLLLLSPSRSPPSSRSIFFLAVVGATEVAWTGNDAVPPEHEAAHRAPRSQRYWDKHGIIRPDYAKTDAEIAAERRGSGRGGTVGRRVGLALLAASAAGIVAMFAVANATGRLGGTMSNRPAWARRVARFAEWTTGAPAGPGGGRLGGSSSAAATGGGEEEARRAARLARFDNPRNMLDDMKTD